MKDILDELNFVYALAEHCNLNCAGCDHFAPLASPQFAEYDEFTRDFQRLSEIFDGKCRRIGLMGGEPLLCPNIEKYMAFARKCFPWSQISIVTNGILLDRMSIQFFDTCKQYSIEIEYTKYPIEYDYDSIHRTIESKGVTISAYGNSGDVVKELYYIPLDIEGKQDITWNFNNCFHSNSCIQLKHGKLYTCTIVPNVEHFNKAFDTKLVVAPEDAIDIYDMKIDAEKVLDRLAKPIPFCRYCNVKGRKENIPWHRSCRLISEWTKDE